MELKTNQIRTDGGTQARAQLDNEAVQEYRDILKENGTTWPFPPVIVFYDGKDHWLADGFHRIAAARQHGRFVVEADVRQGTQRDAVLFAVGANADHGLRRTAEDKRRAVMRLLEDGEWGQLSDREIARRCKVSPTFVGGLRVTVHVDSEELAQRTYTNKHGNQAVMNTAAIGGKQEQPPKIEPTRTIEVSAAFLELVGATYSADKIMNGKIEAPFEYEGELYVCVGAVSSYATGISGASAVRIVPLAEFDRKTVTYGSSFSGTAGYENLGYYGIKVKCKTDEYVMAYPEIEFVLEAQEETAVSDELSAPGILNQKDLLEKAAEWLTDNPNGTEGAFIHFLDLEGTPYPYLSARKAFGETRMATVNQVYRETAVSQPTSPTAVASTHAPIWELESKLNAWLDYESKFDLNSVCDYFDDIKVSYRRGDVKQALNNVKERHNQALADTAIRAWLRDWREGGKTTGDTVFPNPMDQIRKLSSIGKEYLLEIKNDYLADADITLDAIRHRVTYIVSEERSPDAFPDRAIATEAAEIEEMLVEPDPRLQYLKSSLAIIDQMRVGMDATAEHDLFFALNNIALAMYKAIDILK